MIICTGVGQDGEALLLEQVHNACYLVHALGNQSSPFEFSGKEDAIAFIQILGKIRIIQRCEDAVNGDQ